MMRSRTNIVSMAVVIVVILAIAYVFLMRTPSTSQPVEVTKCSIDPSSVTVGQSATITSETKSNDKNNTHEIMVVFSIQPIELINFSSGTSNNLSHPSPYVWQYTYTLDSRATYSRPITVNAYLQSGYSSADYRIQVTFYSDNNQFDNRTLDLIVSG